MPRQEETKHIQLPYETFAEVPEEIKYIRSFFEFLNNPRQYNLPGHVYFSSTSRLFRL